MVAPPRPRRWGGLNVILLAQQAQLFARRRPVDVERGHHHFCARAAARRWASLAVVVVFRRLAGRPSRSPRRRRRQVQRRRLGAQHLDQIVMDDLDHLLTGCDRPQDLLADGPVAYLVDEGFDHVEATSASSKATRTSRKAALTSPSLRRRAASTARTHRRACRSIRRAWSVSVAVVPLQARTRPCSNPRGRTEPAKVSWPLLPREAREAVDCRRRVKPAAPRARAWPAPSRLRAKSGRRRAANPQPLRRRRRRAPAGRISRSRRPPRRHAPAVQFGDDQAADLGRILKRRDLGMGVLADRAVQTSTRSWGAAGSCLAITRLILASSSINSRLFCNRPAVSITTHRLPLPGRGQRLKATAAASAPGAPAITGTPTRSPQTCNCSTAAARKCRRRRPGAPRHGISGRICQSWWFCRYR